MGNAEQEAHAERFSVVLGGPLYQLFLRWRLLEPPVGFVARRIAVAIALAWLPLAALTLLAGTAFGGTHIPFFLDPDVHVRLLVALPLLLSAEPLVHQRLATVLRQFIERGIVPPEERRRVAGIVDDTVRLRNSIVIEVLLLAAAFGIGPWLWHQTIAPRGMGSWVMASATRGEEALSAAGAWYAFVSLGLFRFVLLRWYFRLALWYVFAWRLARLPLRVNALHPDGAGGLGFLGGTLSAMLPILLAQSVAVAGVIGTQLLYQNVRLDSFYLEIGTIVVLLLVMGVAPLLFFMPVLMRAGLAGRIEYGELAMRYVDEFRAKWLRRPAGPGEPVLGSADIQSLADLANSHEVVQRMGVLPVSVQAITRLAIAVAVPFTPLLLSLIPLNELVGRVVKKLL